MRIGIIATLLLMAILPSCSTSNKPTAKAADPKSLEGEWVMDFISGPRIAFDGLYPDAKPSIAFNVAEGRVSGNTSCNSFNGKLNATGNKISFADPMGMTKRFCDGGGETTFLEVIKKVDNWKVDGNNLFLRMGDVDMMRFVKKP